MRRHRRSIVATVALAGCLATLVSGSRPAAAIDPLPFGVNTFTSTGSHTIADVADAASNLAPGSIVRLTVPWFLIQPGSQSLGGGCTETTSPVWCTNPGSPNWAFLDNAIAAFGAAGLRVVLVPIRAPAWARPWTDFLVYNLPAGIVAPPGNNPTNLGQWQTFTVQMVQRAQMAVSGVHPAYPDIVAGVEVWNEPNGETFWTIASGPDPVRYKNLVCHVTGAFDYANIDVPVLFAGLHPFPRSEAIPGRKIYLVDFLDAAYVEGVASCTDAVGVHGYPLTDETVADFEASVDLVRQATVGTGDEGAPLSITEVGFGFLAEQTQADLLVGAYQAAEQMDDVNMFIVHSLFEMGDSMHICTAPDTPRQAAHDLKAEVTGTSTPASC